MILKFKPSKYYKNIFMIDFEKLKAQQIELVACDLDNTLVVHDILYADDKIKQLITKIEALGLKFVILSNNNKKRVSTFALPLNIDYYYSSKKPLNKNFIKLLQDHQIEASKVCLIGDQIMTDIYGANRLNIMSILVDPLADRDILYTKVNRFFEKRVVKKLAKKNLFKVGEYYE